MIEVDRPSAGANQLLLWVMGALALTLGLALGAPALYALAGAMGLYLALGWFGARGLLDGLHVRRVLYPSAFEADVVDVRLELTHRGRRVAHLIEILDRFGPSLATRHSTLEPGPVSRGRRRLLNYHGVCGKHWGIYECGPLELVAFEPLGLFRVQKRVPDMVDFTVFPRVSEVPGLDIRGALASLVPEELTSPWPGQGAMTLGVREWRPGDDPRRMHWAALARHGKPMVREMELELHPVFTLVVDLEERLRAGMGLLSTTEFVMRTAASMLWTVMRRHAVFQVFAEAQEPLHVPLGRGQDHLTVALHQLMLHRRGGQRGILDVVEATIDQMPPRSSVAILSSTIELDLTHLEALLEELQAKGVRPIVVAVNNFAFRQVERYLKPREEVGTLIAELEEVLVRQQVTGWVLARPDEEVVDDVTTQLTELGTMQAEGMLEELR